MCNMQIGSGREVGDGKIGHFTCLIAPEAFTKGKVIRKAKVKRAV